MNKIEKVLEDSYRLCGSQADISIDMATHLFLRWIILGNSEKTIEEGMLRYGYSELARAYREYRQRVQEGIFE